VRVHNLTNTALSAELWLASTSRCHKETDQIQEREGYRLSKMVGVKRKVRERAKTWEPFNVHRTLYCGKFRLVSGKMGTLALIHFKEAVQRLDKI